MSQRFNGEPSDGQIQCQGGDGHHWDVIPTPYGYESMWWLTVHRRCGSCGTIKISHMDAYGRTTKPEYRYPETWVRYSGETAPTHDDRRLARIAMLGPEFVAVNQKVSKRKVPWEMRKAAG